MREWIIFFLLYAGRNGGGALPMTPREFYRYHPAVLNTGTIGIVVPYGSPTLKHDVNLFSECYGLPLPNMTVIGFQNEKDLNFPHDLGWMREASLDVQWAHVMAPLASLTIYISPSALPRDLIETIQTIRGVDVVSMSWGTPFHVTDDVFRSATLVYN